MEIKSLFRTDFASYTAANVFHQVIYLSCEIFTLSLVLPENVGKWQQMLVLSSYLVIFRLGLLNAFNREYPALISCSSSGVSRAKLMGEVTLMQMALAACISSIFFLAYGFYLIAIYSDADIHSAAFVMAIFCLFEAHTLFCESRLRCELKFNVITKIRLFSALLIVLLLLLPLIYDYHGMLLRIALIGLSGSILVHIFSTNQNYGIKFDKQIWGFLFKTGWKIWIWSYLKNFNLNLPKLFLLYFGSIELLGLYAPVGYVLVAFTLVTSSVNSYIYPKLVNENDNLRGDIIEVSIKICGLFLAISLPIALVGVFIADYVFPIILPNYSEALFAIKIALVISCFDISSIISTVCISRRDWLKLYTLTFLALVTRSIFLYLIIFDDEITLDETAMALLYASILIASLNFIALISDRKKLN